MITDFCVLCEDGGDLLMCDGPCLRTFHLQCLGMDSMPKGEKWFCPDCSNKTHLCLVCNEIGNAQTSNKYPFAAKDDVFSCSMPNCGR